MNRTFRIIALTMSLFLLSALLPVTLLAEGLENVTVDNSALYEDAIELLYRFDFISEKTFDAQAKITRGDFIGIAMQLTGALNQFAPSATVFSDVNAETENSGAIKAATDMGIISGFSDGTFKPDNTLTCEQAAKILVSLLGYDVYALSYGGYPSGYLTVAAMQGLLKHITVGDYQECTQGVAAQLIYNAMHTDILQSQTYPEDKYTTYENENPMTKWMGIYVCEGVVSSNEITSVSSSKGTSAGRIIITSSTGNEIFEENETDAALYLGKRVKAYYKSDEYDIKHLMSIKQTSHVYETSINAKDIDDKTDGQTVYWYPNGGIELSNMAFEAQPVVIYNGKYTSSALTHDLLTPEAGSLRLIDNDGNNKADVVFIEDLQIYVVEHVTSKGVIRDKYGKPTLNIDLSDSSIIIDITKYGEKIEFSEIRENTVLSVLKSLDGKYIKLDASTTRLKGTLEEIGDDFIKILGKDYPIAKSNLSEIKKLNPGTKTTFLFTSDDAVAGYGDISDSGSEYGYLIVGAVSNEGIGRGNAASARIFTSSSGAQTYEFAENPTLNGKRKDANGTTYTPASILKTLEVYTSPAAAGSETIQRIFCNQLIKYSINPDGQISDITQPLNNTTSNGGTGKYVEEFSLDYSFRSTSSSSYLIYRNFGFINGKYDAAGCKGFKVPLESTWADFYNNSVSLDDIEKQMSVFSSSSWGDNLYIYNLDIFDLEEDKTCGVVIQYVGGVSAAIPDYDLFLVDRITNTVDKDGMEVKKLYGIYKGKHQGWIIDSETVPESDTVLKQGDIIRVAIDAANEIKTIYKVFTMKKADQGDWTNGGWLLNGEEFDLFGSNASADAPAKWSDYTRNSGTASNFNRLHSVMHGKYDMVVGKTLHVYFGYKKGQSNAPLDTRLMTITERCKFYVYDEEKGEVYVGSADDIDVDDPKQTVVIRNRYYENYEGIIINRAKDPGEIYWVGPFSK